MKKKMCLNSDPQEFYKQFVPYIMEDPDEGIALIEELSDSLRYKEDYEFRTYVQTARAVAYSLQGEYAKIVPLCSNLIDRAEALELWPLVSINKGILGNSYFMFGGFERALDCYYSVIKNDELHNLNDMTSTAYNNIGLIFDELGDYQRAFKYLLKAVENGEDSSENILDYDSSMIFFLSSLISVLCKLEKIDEACGFFQKIKVLDFGKVCPDSLCIYHKAKMYYYFYTDRHEKAKAEYYEALKLVSKKYSIKYMALFDEFISLCVKFGLSHDFYASEMEDFAFAKEVDYNFFSQKGYLFLRRYYQIISDYEGIEKATVKYFEYCEKNDKELEKIKKDFLYVFEGLLSDKIDFSRLRSRNTELKMIADEAVRNKNKLQAAYDRIELINELGKKMTSSLNLEKVVELIYKNLSNNLPIDSFSIMVAEPENNRLRSIACYLYGELMPEITISLDNKDSIFVECYKINRMIINDVNRGLQLYSEGIKRAEEMDMKSAVFIPLEVNDAPIGVCSMQYRNKNAYSSKHIDFLKDLLPYLSISLNNAIRSWEMEKEIQSYLVTQKELKKVNERLAKLSSLDGLTQISSRRDFEIKFIMMLKKARLERKEIAVFMLDIDNFKLYNDTYGHLEGDEVLKKIAQIVKDVIDGIGGLSARFGGEEFIAAVIGLSRSKCEEIGNKICNRIYELNIRNELTPLKRISVSVGVAVGKNLSILQKSMIMRQADISLYTAKNTGKNKVVISDYFNEQNIKF